LTPASGKSGNVNSRKGRNEGHEDHEERQQRRHPLRDDFLHPFSLAVLHALQPFFMPFLFRLFLTSSESV
jgi:hypothetical protein